MSTGQAGDGRAVLYLPAAQEEASEEGHAFAEARGLDIIADIQDQGDQVIPQKRPGWCHVRDLAAQGTVSTVVMRWPDVLSPDHELRYEETAFLREHGVRVLYSWQPLTAANGGGASR